MSKHTKSTEFTKKDEWECVVRRLHALRAVVCPPPWLQDAIALWEAKKLRLEDELWPATADGQVSS